MKIGPLPDALEPGFHCVRTQWIRGFITLRLARHTRTVMLMVLAWPESVSELTGIGRGEAGTRIL